MADTIPKPKLQLRTGVSVNGDKTPSPATKLLINHGKPNFTISRSNSKLQHNGDSNNLNNNNNNNNENGYTNANNNSDFVVKSTKFNGVFKPANVTLQKQVSTENEGIKVVLRPTRTTDTPAAATNGTQENEAAKVVLRRAKLPEPSLREGEDESVPEFIRRQRRIQERLAKENILDFESRRSGYFTHVMISPTATTANRTSFIETMSSPAIVPALEIPPPTPKARIEPATLEEVEEEKSKEQPPVTTAATTNGFINDEDEVAKAIEEVNKAVAGEDDDKITEFEQETVEAAQLEEAAHAVELQEVAQAAANVVAATIAEASTEIDTAQNVTAAAEVATVAAPAAVAVTTAALIEEPIKVEQTAFETATTEAEAIRVTVAAVATSLVVEENNVQVVESKQNGHAEELQQNGHAEESTENSDTDVAISHTNGVDGPSIPTPDPSGALGVNFEPKTVVSFSKDLASEPNKYPDTVMVVKDNEVATTAADDELRQMGKLKFDIKADDQDVQVTPVLRAEGN